MINTVDLTSHQSGYDQYCEEIERENRVPYSDYEIIENRTFIYENFIEDLENVFEESSDDSEKLKYVQALLEDLKEDLEDV
ncbi:MAG: hypothetical protein HFJ12_01395 [Bacilli bacterium]|nr:hypothetical protein [Bacilli bacterium]